MLYIVNKTITKCQAENAIRTLALGRKNWLPARPACRPQSGRRWASGGFAGNERGGKAAALLLFDRIMQGL